MSGFVFLLLLWASFRNGDWKVMPYALFLPAILFTPIAFVRVEVDEAEIRLKNFGFVQKRSIFEDIGRSFVSVLAEKDWPASLTIVGKSGREKLMTVRTKLLRKEDVDWLLARPELKIGS